MNKDMESPAYRVPHRKRYAGVYPEREVQEWKEPYRELVWAVVKAALADYAGLLSTCTPKDQATAEAWLFGSGQGCLPLAKACEVLGIPVAGLRRVATEMAAEGDLYCLLYHK